jgi:hypothetical protein
MAILDNALDDLRPAVSKFAGFNSKRSFPSTTIKLTWPPFFVKSFPFEMIRIGLSLVMDATAEDFDSEIKTA